jgi:hypothetical protein
VNKFLDKVIAEIKKDSPNAYSNESGIVVNNKVILNCLDLSNMWTSIESQLIDPECNESIESLIIGCIKNIQIERTQPR